MVDEDGNKLKTIVSGETIYGVKREQATEMIEFVVKDNKYSSKTKGPSRFDPMVEGSMVTQIGGGPKMADGVWKGVYP